MSAASVVTPRRELPPKPRNILRLTLIIAVLVALTVAACTPAIGGVDIDLASISKHWANGAKKLGQMMQPNFAFLPRTVGPMLETLQMAVVGAVLAAIISVPLTLWAAKPTNANSVSRSAVRGVVNVVRAVPDLVYASVLVAMVGVGVLPGLITLVLFDLGIIVKLVSEAIDSADHGYMEAGRAAGGTQLQINRVTALPQTMPLFANQWLYTLELNGRILDERRNFYAYGDVSVIILEILVVVVLIEVLSNALRKRLA